ncbi:stealth family protein [Arthrobacter sp. NPDC055138]
MVKDSVQRVLRRVHSEASKQVSARAFVRHARRSGLSENHRILTHFRVPLIWRIDPALRLPEQRLKTFAMAKDILQDAGIAFWVVPRRSNQPSAIGVAASDRERAWSVLKSSDQLGQWYCAAVSEKNRAAPIVKRVSSGAAGSPQAIRIWEYVRANVQSTFTAGPQQGVDIQFWDLDEQGILQPPVWTERATSLSPVEAADCDEQGIPRVWSTYGHLAWTQLKVDVVYTWVDGTDPVWLEEKAAAAGVADVAAFTERAHHDARFADHDELRYSLRSLEQFAPWVNNIWIVTAGQTPSWLNTGNPKVHIVDHKDIWPDETGMPNFNSHAIEACLHRIPGLSEYFLYLNDDMLLGRPVASELFFHPNGVGKVFQSRALVDFRAPAIGEIASSTAAKNAREILIQDFGVVQTQKFFHTAAALRVSVMEDLEDRHPAAFKETRGAVFRTTSDIAAAGSLYLNHALASGAAVPGKLRYEYVDPATEDGLRRMSIINRSRGYDAFCVNDGATEQTDEEREASDLLIRRFLSSYLPVASEFEIPRI